MERINKLLAIMKEMECDCAVITDRANVRYLSGFTGSAGYLIISERENLLITDFRYIEQAKGEANSFEIINIKDFNEKDYGNKFSSAAFENESLSYMEYLKIEGNFKNLKPLNKELLKMRSIKDEKEIECIRKAEKIGDDAFSYIMNIIKPGMTEIQLAREIDFYMLSHGAERLSFETIVASGPRGSMPHATPSENTIKNGDLVVMDFGCVFKGYCSDMTRTVGIGRIDDAKKDAYNTVYTAQLESLKKIKAGEDCAFVHNTAFDIIDKKYKGMFGHALGHGVGLEIHEQPTFAPKSNYTLNENVVISVEPGVYIPNLCGVRIEDLVLTTKDGYENLTSSPKDLIII